MAMVTAAMTQSSLATMMALNSSSWNRVGKMLNRAKDSSVSMPLVPRSITRESPPVLRSR